MITNSKNKIITIGETYLSSKSEDLSLQGYEINVATSLSSFGQEVVYLTAVPDSVVGEAATALMMKRGINTEYVVKVEQYNAICEEQQSNSKLPESGKTDTEQHYNILWNALQWNLILKDAHCFFWSQSLARQKSVFDSTTKILKKIHSRGVLISTDLSFISSTVNHRKNRKDKSASLIRFSTIVIAGVNDINKLLGTDFGTDRNGFISACKHLTLRYPNIIKIFDKVNFESKCYGRGWVNDEYIETYMIEIGTVLNSNGAGQSFTAGLLYILRFHQDIHALNFATAAYALNYSAIDDYNTASINQIINTYQSSRMSQGEIVI